MDNIILTDPFLYIISLYLCPKDLLSLKFTSKTLDKIINKKMFNNFVIKNVNSRLYHIFGEKLNEFKKIIQSTKCFISGSFIVQTILGEQWDGSDIDIYTTDGTDEEPPIIENYLRETMNFNSETRYGARTLYITDNLKITSVKDFLDPFEYKRIQIIRIEINNNSFDDAKNYIHETFDFDICKNLYYIDTNELLSIYHPNDIYNNIIYIESESDEICYPSKITDRYLKYIYREFKIIVNNNDLTQKIIDYCYLKSITE